KRTSFALRKLVRLARVSGGDAFRTEDRQDLEKLFQYLSRLRTQQFRIYYTTTQKPGNTIDLELRSPQLQSPLYTSYTIPQALTKESTPPKGKLWDILRHRLPEIVLLLIALLLVAVIILLFFRRQEIHVRVDAPQTFVEPSPPALPEKRQELGKAKLPLDYCHAWLVEKEGPRTGKRHRIRWHVATIGYADENSIVIEDNTVSPRHAKIERQGKKFILYDLMSENGTWLNGKKLLRPKELHDFDEIAIGRTKLIFRKSAEPYAQESTS
ncbi:MAG: FHA domain-containing protein, partial [Turneriella sp.]|nr:FHA domain-containing protein [Turneriella sp.]